MKRYVILLRGINVGGKNRIPMADLRACLAELGFSNVRTYIASGNILLDSDLSAKTVRRRIESVLPDTFELDSDIIRIMVLTIEQLQTIYDERPAGFGEAPQTYHNDAIFLIDTPVDEALTVFNPRDGVDAIWPGEQVIYSQRLSAERTKSRLGQIVGTPPYANMTIRSWNTVTKLLALAKD